MTIRRFVVALVGMSMVLGGGPSAQETTEQFIPLGQSPGLSGNSTVIGKLQSVNAREQICSVASAAGTVNAKITERTKIWLDRSLIRQPNVKGTIADLKPGLTVEVKPEGHPRGVPSGPAEWIKVQVPASP